MDLASGFVTVAVGAVSVLVVHLLLILKEWQSSSQSQLQVLRESLTAIQDMSRSAETQTNSGIGKQLEELAVTQQQVALVQSGQLEDTQLHHHAMLECLQECGRQLVHLNPTQICSLNHPKTTQFCSLSHPKTTQL